MSDRKNIARYAGVFLAAAGFSLVSQAVVAGEKGWCDDLNVTVSTGKGWEPFKQQMIVSTSAVPGPLSKHYGRDMAFVRVKIEFTYSSSGRPGARGGEEEAQIQLKTPWGNFAQAQSVFSPGPVTSVRVRDVHCLPWTHGH